MEDEEVLDVVNVSAFDANSNSPLCVTDATKAPASFHKHGSLVWTGINVFLLCKALFDE